MKNTNPKTQVLLKKSVKENQKNLFNKSKIDFHLITL